MSIEISKIYNENCIETLARMPGDWLDMTITSPPYDDLRDYNDYHFPVEEIAAGLFAKTKPGGHISRRGISCSRYDDLRQE